MCPHTFLHLVGNSFVNVENLGKEYKYFDTISGDYHILYNINIDVAVSPGHCLKMYTSTPKHINIPSSGRHVCACILNSPRLSNDQITLNFLGVQNLASVLINL